MGSCASRTGDSVPSPATAAKTSSNLPGSPFPDERLREEAPRSPGRPDERLREEAQRSPRCPDERVREEAQRSPRRPDERLREEAQRSPRRPDERLREEALASNQNHRHLSKKNGPENHRVH